jgi:hypothetical protein
MDFEAQLSALKRALEVETDMALAECLGLQRFAVSKWRKRTSIPSKYLALIPPTKERVSGAIDAAFRFTLFHKPGNAFILAAAISAFPYEKLSGFQADTAEKAIALEQLMLRLASVAVSATNLDLEKETCESQDDYLQLVRLLKTKYADDVLSVIEKFSSRLGLAEGASAEAAK